VGSGCPRAAYRCGRRPWRAMPGGAICAGGQWLRCGRVEGEGQDVAVDTALSLAVVDRYGVLILQGGKRHRHTTDGTLADAGYSADARIALGGLVGVLEKDDGNPIFKVGEREAAQVIEGMEVVPKPARRFA
jgi:hypothetical protein